MGNNRVLLGVLGVLIGGAIFSAGFWYFVVNQPAEREPKSSPNQEEPGRRAEGPFTLPKGFAISTLTDKVPGARVLVQDSFGNFWVSQTSEGIISTLEMNDDGTVRAVHQVFRNMKNPHGIALDPLHPFAFYIAEENKISRVGLYSDSPIEKLIDLPAGGRHTTRSIGFSPDGKKLYVSIGSSCDVCYETDERRAAIYSMDPDGSDFALVAKGLRNAVFFAWDAMGKMWATEMGRDNLGDNLPPDEINIIGPKSDYGWPICYGQGIHDSDFDERQYVRDPCEDPADAQINVQAHSAPLGLAFIPREGWPEEYWDDLLVAYHGSWNRSEKTGYKIVRFALDQNGNPEGGTYKAEDFITGWLEADGNVIGRPVDVKTFPNGLVYITDDHAGKIYKVEWKP